MLSNAQKAKFDNGSPDFARRAALHFARAGDALRWLLPAQCALCAVPSASRLLCEACVVAMPGNGDACPRCGLATPGGAVCGRCLASPPPYSATVAAWRYAFPADRLLQAFKYAGQLALAEPLADALAAAVVVRGVTVDGVVALASSRERQRMRGFNPAQEIARRVAHRLALRCDGGLDRVRDDPPQAGRSLRERSRNVHGAFAATRRFDGRCIAIVDDVMTTGATMSAATRALLAAGAVRVDAWVVARTPPRRDRASATPRAESGTTRVDKG